MEPHGTQPGAQRKAESISQRKEITCADCGHVYLIDSGQRSGTCQACGNVAFVGDNRRELTALSEEIVARRILPRLRDNPVDPLAAFRVTPEGGEVEALRTKYQVEWQLWAALVMNFQSPAFHSAYLSLMLASNGLEQAANRYREHRSVMALLDDSRWQAEISDLMIARIEALALSRMPNSRGDYSFDIPGFFKVLPFDSRLTKVIWIAFGFFLVAKFLHLTPI